MSKGLRKCTLRKWPDFAGYGFNLHAEKGKAGQYVGVVDEGSPAAAAGIKEGDRIVEVNDVNIGNENHQQVVSRIKAGGDSVTLLVVDQDADDHYKSNKIVIKGDMAEVETLECPSREQPDIGTSNGDDIENDYEVPDSHPSNNISEAQLRSTESISAHSTAMEDSEDEELPPPPPPLVPQDVYESNSEVTDVPYTEPEREPELEPEPYPEPEPEVEETVHRQMDNQPEPNDSTEENGTSEASNSVTVSQPEVACAISSPAPEPPIQTKPANDNLPDTKKLSAAEMREMLKKKKRPDPRTANLSASDKMRMFQRL